MSNAVLEFGGFRLEAAERRLSRDGAAVEVSQRYLDALLLLARHPGELITKDRFMDEVWRGVPVTDEALTQCIRSLRKALRDEAARPKFIETVPKHGYRFVAAVREVGGPDAAAVAGGGNDMSGVEATTIPAALPQATSTHPALGGLNANPSSNPPSAPAEVLLLAGAGLAGGGAAGLIGGIGYGLLAATDPPAGTGAISILLVMTCVCLLVGLLAGVGVGLGIAAGRLVGPGRLFPLMLGGAIGGLVVGSFGRLIGLDAFSLLIGSRPLAITGGSEGLLIGALAGAAFWRVEQERDALPPQLAAVGGLIGAVAGLLVTIGGGKMMAGSLAGLAAAHPEAPLGRLLGDLSPLLLTAAGAIEGAIFIAALALSFSLVLRSRRAS
ncbi:transcriptional regulator [Sphingomonas sp. LHG3406-1]|uniref:winged helix-turn-helix domain-containing protein n=1 Tax=Sphingomonas sp. LHG3406-1 TaxID=2804617 RepID=UPI002623B07C|nr:transcriptional regulator [Sphingomonas sp. LHG3406-1]